MECSDRSIKPLVFMSSQCGKKTKFISKPIISIITEIICHFYGAVIPEKQVRLQSTY